MMQIDHFPSKYGCSPSITGAVPGTNLPEPQPRDWLQMYWRCISWNQPLLAGYLNQLTHHESHADRHDIGSYDTSGSKGELQDV